MKTILIALFFLLKSGTVFSQVAYNNLNFQQVDNYAKSVKHNGDIIELTNKLTSPYSDSINKLRAIFIWITDNIEYDYKQFNSGVDKLKQFKCSGTKAECTTKFIQWKEDWLIDIIKSKKAVCGGYAELFKKMCNIIGIKNEIVGGYVKQTPYQIGLILSASHAWNVIKLDGIDYFFDPTWAAGPCKMDEETGKLLDFVKRYENYYWLIPYNKIVRNHYPKNNKWAVSNNDTKEAFFNAPYFYSTEILKNLNSHLPDTGMISAKIGDTLKFVFEYTKPINKIHLSTNNYQNIEVLLIKNATNKTNHYQFSYIVKENSLYYIEVLFDSKKAIRYKVKT